MRVAIVGTGLIGGSVGMAARRRLGATVAGFGPESVAARDEGAVDEPFEELGDALAGAELAVVAAPLAIVGDLVRRVLEVAPADCVVTDVGSTKAAIVEAIDDERFIGGHPLAGGEASGVAHAREDLFDGAVWYLTPRPTTNGILFERLHRAISRLGARPTAIDPDVHDQLMAVVSHMPHVLANVMVAQAVRAEIPTIGPSFRDATRVAGANPPLWADIMLANREALIRQVDGATELLQRVRTALDAADGEWLLDFQQRAADDRALLNRTLGDGPTHELRVSVPNRPGVIAELALALGRAQINISDMALSPSPDHRRGEVALWVPVEDAERARGIVAQVGSVA